MTLLRVSLVTNISGPRREENTPASVRPAQSCLTLRDLAPLAVRMSLTLRHPCPGIWGKRRRSEESEEESEEEGEEECGRAGRELSTHALMHSCTHAFTGDHVVALRLWTMLAGDPSCLADVTGELRLNGSRTARDLMLRADEMPQLQPSNGIILVSPRST